MISFLEYLRARLAAGGFSTEDALNSFLPLVREVLDTHAAGKVAPLEGLAALHVEGVRIWFEEAQRQPLRSQPATVRAVAAASSAAVEIVTEVRRTSQLESGDGELLDLAVGERGATLARPVYLPGYVAWEHELGHHDPLTDVFSLGLILASLACGLDLTEPETLKRFVAHRRNLFAIQPSLHPVLAQAIFRMTEVDRHRRVQDLRALLHNLENYRDQEIDFEFDLARVLDFGQQDRRSKQDVVLTKLRERLFEISKRNRLLHFRPTLQTVNLTHASVPLSFDIKQVRPDQLLVWNELLHAAVCRGEPISLNKYLNFAEALYLPAVLDHLIADAKRDQAEFGFAQLRLVICFLHWTDLKQKPPEHFDSPLVLLPVELKRKKGIRDTYFLEVISTAAEVNPVIRHQFQQLYAIDLPEVLDLSTTTLDEFFQHLDRQVAASEPAVTLNKLDRPRIALIHEKARRRLDQYCRRARFAGRGVRNFLDLDYSYDPANYHPLGIRLFAAKVRPPTTRLRAILEERPRPRSFAGPEPEPPTAEVERSFFSLQAGREANPYVWNFDLCSVTLGNFKYRKMSLVRDYETLLDERPPNAAFDATFSLAPREATRRLPASRPLEDRFDVVPCDPTQAASIEEAHTGKSYIIQGPPGTGKSQTITNLIADYVARGQRVLFVCEKRAAIDVVFARLRQRGLGDLGCLIHDSQADKKEFVLDLKRTYQDLLAQAGKRTASPTRQREKLIAQIQAELRPLEAFDAAMQHPLDEAGLRVRQLLRRCLELHGELPAIPPLDQEQLPDYATWWQHRERIAAFAASAAEILDDQILAHHPLRLLSPQLLQVDHPRELLTKTLAAAEQHFDQLERTLGQCGIPRDQEQTLARARRLVDYAQQALRVSRDQRQAALLDPHSARSKEFAAAVEPLRQRQRALAAACDATQHWRLKLSAAEVAVALQQARLFAGSAMPWLQLSWWRLRAVLNRCYDFRSHVVRPSWTQLLTALEREYAAQTELDRQRQQLAEMFQVAGDVDQWVRQVVELHETLPALPDWLARIHGALLRSDQAIRALDLVAAADEPLRALQAELGQVLAGHAELGLDPLRADLRQMSDALDDLPDFLQCLRELAALPAALGTALRRLPLTPTQVEAAVADCSLTETLRSLRSVQHFTAASRDRHANRLERLYDDWLDSNAGEIRQRIKRRFLEHVHAASLSASQLTEAQQEFKRRYTAGRRELEHEFGKTMRFKSVRDLVSGDSGEVVRDLKPVWLMSPLSVSDTLPLETAWFDVVIFDEASQITLEEAVPALFRAVQAVVVGDEMQLPPTDFFSAKHTAEEEGEIVVEEGGELVRYDLEGNSFLGHAAKNLPSTMLGWHYRSRSESLISFSNWAFYDGRLLTVPEECLPAGEWATLDATQAADAERGAAAVRERPISFHRLQHGVYDKRRNRAEADYIAHLVRALLGQKTGQSLGIVAFSEAQQEEIEGALERLAQEDAEFRERWEAEVEREVDGQFVGLLVKNLENIQGDERDIVILSICYGPGPNGRMLMNFGPINKSGGEKRLNVAFSRAKHHMVVVSSIAASAITNEYNDGANCLKSYLRYAEAVSAGQREAAQRVLRSMSRWQDAAEDRDQGPEDPLAGQLAAALVEHGYQVDRAVGESHFRCDLAIRRPGDAAYRLGILLDNETYYEQADLLERDMMRPRLLRVFGWKVTVVLAKDWYQDRAAVLDRCLRLLEGCPETLADESLTAEDVADAEESAVVGVPLPVIETPAAIESAADASSRDRPPQVPPDDLSVAGPTRRFEFRHRRSNKFWEITLSGQRHTICYGRIGTAGTTLTRSFPDAAAAQRGYDQLVRSKLAEGYRETSVP
ncbi:MAG: AAA domain-containing protein [Planctomycetota bacterium]|nr:AAA domain-containing protein [Planctomycetota bacterium]